MVSEPREKKKPNYFRFIRESILRNLSVTVFHSGHLSHLLKLSDQPYRRQKNLIAGNLFPAKSFSDTDHTIRCARRRSSSFVKALDACFSPWLLCVLGLFISWILKMPSFMVILPRDRKSVV